MGKFTFSIIEKESKKFSEDAELEENEENENTMHNSINESLLVS